MYVRNNLSLFRTTLMTVVDTLKQQDKAQVESLEKTLVSLLGHNYTEHIFTAAILELSETVPVIFEWTFNTFPNLSACLTLQEQAKKFAIRKLMNQGFILGKDFSANHGGTILLNEKAKNALIASISDTEALLIQKILQYSCSVEC